MPFLSSLLLDNNRLHARSPFPKLKQLRVLTLNNNQIGSFISFRALPLIGRSSTESLDPLLTNLSLACSTLSFLSLLGNACCPHASTVGGAGNAGLYAAYRRRGSPSSRANACQPHMTELVRSRPHHPVVAQLVKLKHLDSETIDAAERASIVAAPAVVAAATPSAAATTTSSAPLPSHRSPAMASVIADLSEQPCVCLCVCGLAAQTLAARSQLQHNAARDHGLASRRPARNPLDAIDVDVQLDLGASQSGR